MVICDGKMLGFCKDLLPASTQENDHDQSVEEEAVVKEGSKHAERTLVKSPKGRELLLRYAGYTRDCKRIARPHPCSSNNSVEEDGFRVMVILIKRLKADTHSTACPAVFRFFFSKLAQSSPACGMVQIGRRQDIVDAVHKALQSDIRVSEHHKALLLLQRSTPVLAIFLINYDGGVRKELIIHMRFLNHILSISLWILHTQHLINPAQSSYSSLISLSTMVQESKRSSLSVILFVISQHHISLTRMIHLNRLFHPK